jgi:hypothetical protein
MKKIVITINLMFILTCSCCDTSYRVDPMEKRYDEVRRIMRAYDISILEKSGNLDARQLRELEKIKQDYYARFSDPFHDPIIAGPDLELLGPLDIEDFKNDGSFEDIYKKFKEFYIKGDEIYLYRSDFLSELYEREKWGYVIIHDDKIVYKY